MRQPPTGISNAFRIPPPIAQADATPSQRGEKRWDGAGRRSTDKAMRPRRSPHAGSRRTQLAATRKSAERLLVVGRTASVLAGVARHARVAGDGEALREVCAARTKCPGAGAGRAGLRGNPFVALETDLPFGPRVLRTTLDRFSNRCAVTLDYPWTDFQIGLRVVLTTPERFSNRTLRVSSPFWIPSAVAQTNPTPTRRSERPWEGVGCRTIDRAMRPRRVTACECARLRAT
jgi:hypothetical protein